ncbi:hypothetical protein [Rhodococcus tibetensis]|uniref:DUF4265 domain-containing protein n=1 Tax=Rhodococcus tibetensis TaxID=2965064 RepID=A0ABT1QH14_9NOCA|nr:hypothetical protein [Rhodococcus sp. FXJ9.536]MCQ4121550.1 hypothetical protein [Rhodococcus sp. FXJ9.536]
MYIVEGRPWWRALDRLVDADMDGTRRWIGAKNCRDGDLLLTVLSTVPRMVVSLETADGDAEVSTDNIRVREERTVLFRHGISFDAVKAGAEINLQLYRHYEDEEAAVILTALDEQYRLNKPWFTPQRWIEDQGFAV